MNYSDFTDALPGRLVPTVFGARAFVPDALPPSINWERIALPLADAHAALGELKGACRRLANHEILVRPLQRLEAQTSSAMEGTYTTTSKLALAEAGVKTQLDPGTKEVSNYVRALHEGVQMIQTKPITHRVIKAAHRTLLSSVGRQRGEDKRPGEYKRDQNMIGGRTLESARFIPAPPQETDEAMSNLEKFINSERDPKLALLDIALAHYQFETIHPFADGNGRVGRMLISLMAVSKGLLETPALYISPALEDVKDEYIDRLYAVSSTGDWTGWLNFFFAAVSRTARTAVQTIDRIINLQDDYREKAAQASRSAKLQSVVDMLFENPVISPRNIVERLKITDTAARNLLSKLVEEGIVVEYSNLYPKVWIALEIIELSQPNSEQS